MKCICFGSLFVLMYQARGQGIKSAPLCSAIFAPFGVNLAYRDTSLPGHLKNGHDKVPSDIADVVRECDPEAAVRSFERTVMPLIKDSMRAPLLQAVLAVLDEDKTIDTNSPVSWLRGYTKGAVLSASSIDLTYLLTSLVRFAILETDNNECADGIREIPDKFVSGFPKSAAPIELDEPGIIIKWPDGELNTAATRKYISDDEIRNDVDVLKKMLSKYKKPDLLPVPLVVDETERILPQLNDVMDAEKDIDQEIAEHKKRIQECDEESSRLAQLINQDLQPTIQELQNQIEMLQESVDSASQQGIIEKIEKHITTPKKTEDGNEDQAAFKAQDNFTAEFVSDFNDLLNTILTEVKFDKFSNCYFDFESEDFDIVVNGKRSRSSAAATKLSLTQRWQLPCTSICPKKANTVLEYC